MPLPTYPFEHRGYWYEPEIVPETAALNDEAYFTKLADMGDWFSLPVFRQRPLPFTVPAAGRRTWLVFADDRGVGARAAEALAADHEVVTVTAGSRYERRVDGSFVLDPADEEGYTALLTELRTQDRLPDRVLYCWPLRRRAEQPHRLDRDAQLAEQEAVLFPVLRFAQALDALSVERPLTFTAVTEDVFDVTGAEDLDVHAATVGGACLVLQQTYGHIASRVVDLSADTDTDRRVAQLLAEIRHDTADLFSAYRSGKRYVRGYEPVRVEADAPGPPGCARAAPTWSSAGWRASARWSPSTSCATEAAACCSWRSRTSPPRTSGTPGWPSTPRTTRSPPGCARPAS